MKLIEIVKNLQDFDIDALKAKIDALGPADEKQKEEVKTLFWAAVIIALKLFIKYGSKAA